MTSLKYELVKTTKDKDSIVCNNFVYNYKNDKKDFSQHFVCNKPGFYSSLTALNDVIVKVNGKKCDNSTELIHAKHDAYTEENIIGMNFVKICKTRIATENSKSAGQIYLEEQSKLINQLGDMQWCY